MLLSMSTIALSQECIEACALPTSTCTYINYPVYPVGLDVSHNDAQVNSIKSISYLNLASEPCRVAVYQYVCAFYYQSCSNTTEFNNATSESEIIPTKIKPCLSQCLNLREVSCFSEIGLIDAYPNPELQDMVNCSRLDTDGTPFFFNDTNQDSSTTGSCYSLSSLTPITRCTNDSTPTDEMGSATGACQAYDPALAPNSTSVCAPFVSNQIYALGNLSNYQTIADQNISEITTLLTRIYPMLPVGCYKRAMSLICQTAFPTCGSAYDETTKQTYPVPTPPCRQSCESALGDCSYILSLMGEEYLKLLDCTSDAWPAGPTYKYAAANSLTSGEAIEVDAACTDLVFPNSAYEAWVLPDFERCPVIMGRKPNPKDKDIQCWVPCPDPTYTPHEWDKLIIVYQFFSSISFVLMLFMLVTSLLDAKRRRLRLHIPIYFSCMMMAVSFFVAGTNPKEQTWCDDPVTYATGSSNARCATQGFFFQFFGLSAVLWWTVIGFHMFASVFMNHSPELRFKEKYYHAFAWGVPLVLTIITSSIDAHGFAPPAPWCYIHDPGYADYYDQGFHQVAGIPIDYYVFYIPIGIALLVTFIFIGLVFFTVFRVLRTAKSLRKAGNDARVQFRIVFFLVVLLLLFILIFEWRFGLETIDTDQLKAEDLAWAVCKIKIDLGFPDTGDCPQDFFPRRINYNYTAFETCLASSFGFWIFVTFGTDPAIYAFYKKLFGYRSWKALKSFIITGIEKEVSGTTAPHSSSNLHKSSSSKDGSSSKDTESRREEETESRREDNLSASTTEVELLERHNV